MRQKSKTQDLTSERIVKDIRRATRKQYSAEEKIRVVLDGLRGEHSIAELCRREGIAESLYYSWSNVSPCSRLFKPKSVSNPKCDALDKSTMHSLSFFVDKSKGNNGWCR